MDKGIRQQGQHLKELLPRELILIKGNHHRVVYINLLDNNNNNNNNKNRVNNINKIKKTFFLGNIFSVGGARKNSPLV